MGLTGRDDVLEDVDHAEVERHPLALLEAPRKLAAEWLGRSGRRARRGLGRRVVLRDVGPDRGCGRRAAVLVCGLRQHEQIRRQVDLIAGPKKAIKTACQKAKAPRRPSKRHLSTKVPVARENRMRFIQTHGGMHASTQRYW